MNERRSPELTRRLAIRGATDVVSRCRDFTRRALTEWCWPGAGYGAGARAGETPGADAADDALLLVSEVVGNACLHAGGATSLVLRCTDAWLRIEVTDESPAAPQVRHRSDLSRPGGHGLRIVERLGRDWGWDAVVGDGKCVWVEIDSPPGHPG
ncbi:MULTISPECIES: ATP-binding protein [unclassified Streptomyces]|uniref:ATP-binding protein n=1 Tax=unclassified Streptomyces TaxID=2593676 RepID=UPI002E0F6445|nr:MULTISPECIES: ATP-binding protein [unclassified Streptomyces]WSR24151.1 ATP-binding protein [Streptomyces sp. NBC_01205]